MKWFALAPLGILLVIFWPRSEVRESSNSARKERFPSFVGKSRSSRSLSPTRNPRRSRALDLSVAELREKVGETWPRVMSDLSAREPSVVELLQTLRELGKLDGPGALEFLDGLDRSGNESAWIRARIAVAGGWSLTDPEAAALALLEKDHVLPADYTSFVSPGPVGSQHPAHRSIMQAASRVFDRWAELSPARAKEEALNQVKELFISGSILLATLRGAPDWGAPTPGFRFAPPRANFCRSLPGRKVGGFPIRNARQHTTVAAPGPCQS